MTTGHLRSISPFSENIIADMKNDKNKESGGTEEVKRRTPKTILVEQYLASTGDFRHNMVNGRFEYRRHGTRTWTTIDRLLENNFRRTLNNTDLWCSRDMLETIIGSGFSKDTDPLKEYLMSLPKREGMEAITILLSSIKIKNDANWAEFMTKWLVAVVANAMDDTRCHNHTCLVLSGGQGVGKTTWLNGLYPQKLEPDYYFIGKFDPDNKDSLRLVSERFLINIDDQLQNINRADEDKIKAVLTQDKISYRKPYDTNVMDYPHRASFMASVNSLDFLTDPTGSRRFLAFEVESIDSDRFKMVNMDLVYAECMTLLKNGFRYWFDREETERLDMQNRSFMSMTFEYQLLCQMFRVPGPDEMHQCVTMTATQIRNDMNETTSEKLNFRNVGKALARLVRENGLVRKSVRINGIPQYCYLLVRNRDFNIRGSMHDIDKCMEA